MTAGSVSGVEIRLVHDRADLERLAETFTAIWGLPDASSIASPDVMRAIAHAGGHVSIAIDPAGAVVGGSMGFRGVHAGRPSLHSHVTGVMPTHVGTGLGAALKRFQRQWAEAEGLHCITWTFDPLVRRNARFNLCTLGAHAEEYLVDFYGPLRDDINGDDESDRLFTVWWLGDETSGPTAPASTGSATVRLVDLDDHSGPVRHDVGFDDTTIDDSTELLVATPPDIVALRRSDPVMALRWRHTVRAAMIDSWTHGFTITGFTADGCYTLRRRDAR